MRERGQEESMQLELNKGLPIQGRARKGFESGQSDQCLKLASLAV